MSASIGYPDKTWKMLSMDIKPYHFTIHSAIDKEKLKSFSVYLENLPSDSFNMKNIETYYTTFDNHGSLDDLFGGDINAAHSLLTSWLYLFQGWQNEDIDNTLEGLVKRINYFLQNGLPSQWDREKSGDVKLSYMPSLPFDLNNAHIPHYIRVENLVRFYNELRSIKSDSPRLVGLISCIKQEWAVSSNYINLEIRDTWTNFHNE